MTNISQRIARAALAQGVTSIIGKAIAASSIIVLARLLYPEDFGLQTIAFMVLALANLISGYGFQTYIIQTKNLKQEDLDACYTLNIIFACILGLLVGGTGIAWNDLPGELDNILMFYGLMIALSAISQTRLAVMKRELKFRESSIAELAFSVSSSLARVGLALVGFGALCFPIGDLVGTFVKLLVTQSISHEAIKIRITSVAKSKTVLAFGAYSIFIGFGNYIGNHLDKAILAASQPLAAVGIYGFATTMSAMFYYAVILPQSNVFIASIARLEGNCEAVRNLLSKTARIIVTIALPFHMLWILDADRIITVIFGTKWIEAAPIVSILSIDFLLRSACGGFSGLAISLGYAHLEARLKMINTAIFSLIMIGAWLSELDLIGFAFAYLFSSIVVTANNVIYNGSLIQFKLKPFISNLLIPIALALVSTLLWLFVRKVVYGWPDLYALVASSGIWLGMYTFLTFTFNRSVIEQLRRNINPPY